MEYTQIEQPLATQSSPLTDQQVTSLMAAFEQLNDPHQLGVVCTSDIVGELQKRTQ